MSGHHQLSCLQKWKTRWCPQAQEKWTLSISIDDYSRKLLFADFFRSETTRAHIQATQALMQEYGLPLRYYADSLRVFHFVQGRDGVWRKHVLETDDVETQWRKIMRLLGVDVSYALSPQAKGKVERSYRRLQDRIVRTCIYENLSTKDEARTALRVELHRYNSEQIHSTTGEIPNIVSSGQGERAILPEAVHRRRIWIVFHADPPNAGSFRPALGCVKRQRTTPAFPSLTFFMDSRQQVCYNAPNDRMHRG